MQETQEMQVRSLGQEDPCNRIWQPTTEATYLSTTKSSQKVSVWFVYNPWGCILWPLAPGAEDGEEC